MPQRTQSSLKKQKIKDIFEIINFFSLSVNSVAE